MIALIAVEHVRYEEAFTRQEIDWDSLQWLTEEDLLSMGVTALGPRKKIVHALDELKKRNVHQNDMPKITSGIAIAESKKLVVTGNKLITEFFQGSSAADRSNDHRPRPKPPQCGEKITADFLPNKAAVRKCITAGRFKAIPSWCCIPGTPFKVDAFRYLRGDCTYWFLTHFHIDHYQGLTRGFCHGKIYCSSITAHLVNTKLGVPWDKLQVLPLNQKISISGVEVTFLDANHCPGSVVILFEPPNKKAVLHTGDFRYSEEMASCTILQSCNIHTLILDTTYCNPQYDFPKQEAVIQFVIEAIQAETFNPKTLFLIGSYTIGKERLFLEIARFLRRKIYVGAAKLKLLGCMRLPEEDMQWFTLNERESNIHVVPMWTIASFKRLKHLSNQYSSQFNAIVAFSPTGWTYGKGKKRTPGRRWQQGTIIRYEVPYSEHSSFSELREFVQFLSPEKIIPSVNNKGPESAEAMVTLLTSNS
ncbi:DNA cross-link repair protein SNM1 isoform X2 [Aristolochia californica]|uniref:DNA cross-link repair protein SNM1 isoform X2 n=1 Tax=Aristolochia californica TaxID=171875 RepID=UPI0035E089AB